jgi:hypothetical protein
MTEEVPEAFGICVEVLGGVIGEDDGLSDGWTGEMLVELFELLQPENATHTPMCFAAAAPTSATAAPFRMVSKILFLAVSTILNLLKYLCIGTDTSIDDQDDFYFWSSSA